jgi:hypothetical protein
MEVWMSELEDHYIFGSNRYHDLPPRTDEQIDAAYYHALTSPAGQIIMDDLYNMVCCTYLPDVRAIGQVDLRNYMLSRMQKHLARARAYERVDDGREYQP